MDQWSGILIAIMLAILGTMIGRKYLRRKHVVLASDAAFPPPRNDEI